MENGDLKHLIVCMEKIDINEERRQTKAESNEEQIEAQQAGKDINVQGDLQMTDVATTAGQDNIETDQNEVNTQTDRISLYNVQGDLQMTDVATTAGQDNIETDQNEVNAQTDLSLDTENSSKDFIFSHIECTEVINTWLEDLMASVDMWKQTLFESAIENTPREHDMQPVETEDVWWPRGSQSSQNSVYRARLPTERRWARTGYRRTDRQTCVQCGRVGHSSRHCRWGYFHRHSPEEITYTPEREEEINASCIIPTSSLHTQSSGENSDKLL
jgi:hypothetical protein